MENDSQTKYRSFAVLFNLLLGTVLSGAILSTSCNVDKKGLNKWQENCYIRWVMHYPSMNRKMGKTEFLALSFDLVLEFYVA